MITLYICIFIVCFPMIARACNKIFIQRVHIV